MARSKRCSAWRSVGYKPHHGQGHVPFGTDGGQACRKCWVPCKNRMDGGAYCDECLSRLSTDPRGIVRRSLASDPMTPDSTVSFLTTDGDESVVVFAKEECERRGLMREEASSPRHDTEPASPWE